MGALNRSWALLGFCLSFSCHAGSLAFTLGNTLGSVDLDTTLPLTTAAFWQFAHSQDFYRSTRQQSVTVRQEVVDLSNWEQVDGPALRKDNQADKDNSPGSTSQPQPPSSPAPAGVRARARARVRSSRAGRVLCRLVPSEARRQPQPPQQQRQPQPPTRQQQPQQQQQQQKQHPQQPQQPRPRLWHRKARLNYAISSPFGSSDATVVQEHRLLELDPDHQEAGDGDGGSGGVGKSICYSETDCITGFPMIPGDLSVKTTFLVTPADGNPERVRVRVGVKVEEIELPRRLQFLNKRVSKIIGNGGRKQAEKWLAEMITAGSPAASAAASSTAAVDAWHA